VGDVYRGYLLGLATTPAGLSVVLLVLWLRETGRRVRCSDHGWDSGPLDSTRRWRRLLRFEWHRWTRHTLKGEPRG
jgi:hypothetical protein